LSKLTGWRQHRAAPTDWSPEEQHRARWGQTPPLRFVRYVVCLLESLSPGNVLSQRLHTAARNSTEPNDRLYARYRAAQIIDWYIASWLAVEIVLLLTARWVPSLLFGTLAAFRLIEICVIWTYAVLFEEAEFEMSASSASQSGAQEPTASGTTTQPPRYSVVSRSRSMVHAITMFTETILCFGLIYLALRSHIPTVCGADDALDLSLQAITGAPDVAQGWARFVVDIEPLVVLLFAATVLSRLVGGLRQMREDHGPPAGSAQSAPAQVSAGTHPARGATPASRASSHDPSRPKPSSPPPPPATPRDSDPAAGNEPGGTPG